MPTTRIRLRGVNELVDDQLYTAAEVAGLFRVDRETVYVWVADKKLEPEPWAGRGHRFLGTVIRRFFDARHLTMLSGPTETRAEREQRAKEARDEIMGRLRKAPHRDPADAKRLAKGRPKSA